LKGNVCRATQNVLQIAPRGGIIYYRLPSVEGENSSLAAPTYVSESRAPFVSANAAFVHVLELFLLAVYFLRRNWISLRLWRISSKRAFSQNEFRKETAACNSLQQPVRKEQAITAATNCIYLAPITTKLSLGARQNFLVYSTEKLRELNMNLCKSPSTFRNSCLQQLCR